MKFILTVNFFIRNDNDCFGKITRENVKIWLINRRIKFPLFPNKLFCTYLSTLDHHEPVDQVRDWSNITASFPLKPSIQSLSYMISISFVHWTLPLLTILIVTASVPDSPPLGSLPKALLPSYPSLEVSFLISSLLVSQITGGSDWYRQG